MLLHFKIFGLNMCLPSRKLLVQISNGNTRAIYKICLKLTIKTPTSFSVFTAKHSSGVFIVNFEHVSHVVLVFPLLTLNKKYQLGIFFLNFFFQKLHLALIILSNFQTIMPQVNVRRDFGT